MRVPGLQGAKAEIRKASPDVELRHGDVVPVVTQYGAPLRLVRVQPDGQLQGPPTPTPFVRHTSPCVASPVCTSYVPGVAHRLQRPTGIAFLECAAPVLLFVPDANPSLLQIVLAPSSSSQKWCPQTGYHSPE